jgi:hypothetical protein
MRRLSTVALATLVATATSAISTSAMAQSRVEVGVLDCRGSTSSFVVGSVTELNCVFSPSGGGRPEPYHATIRRVGVDIGFNQQVAVAWAVLAPSRGIPRYDLGGNYAGGAASATVGVGAGANALVGGSGNTFALQPVSVQGQTGLSVAAGIASMELRAGR